MAFRGIPSGSLKGQQVGLAKLLHSQTLYKNKMLTGDADCTGLESEYPWCFLSLELRWVFFDPQGTQAIDQSKGGLQGLTIPQRWPFLSGSEAFGLGICCFLSENSGFIGAIEPAQMLARWRRSW